jgi:D-methionine transport system substrate-binding protein
MIPVLFDSFEAVVMNGNFAMDMGLTEEQALAREDPLSPRAGLYANLLVTRPEDRSRPEILALARTLKSAPVKKFIEDNFGGKVVPAP